MATWRPASRRPPGACLWASSARPLGGPLGGPLGALEVTCSELFGAYDSGKVRRVERGEPRGQRLVLLEGQSGLVLERSEGGLLVDLNHPLAGRDVNVTAGAVE